jgi:NitT/TauT family transport system substrate-binding protein
LNFASLGTTAFLTLWSKTKGTPQEVRGVSAFGSFPFYLNTRNPNIKTVKDFTDSDKIAVPAVKVSNQALMLQIAAEQTFGLGHASDLDKFTVSMSHPDGLTAMLSGRNEVNSHFTWDPFHSRELAVPGVRTILDSSDSAWSACYHDIGRNPALFPRSESKDLCRISRRFSIRNRPH